MNLKVFRHEANFRLSRLLAVVLYPLLGLAYILAQILRAAYWAFCDSAREVLAAGQEVPVMLRQAFSRRLSP